MSARPTPLVLIRSDDPIAASLLGGLVELLGYEVQFASMGGDDSFRRVRPRIYMIDCDSVRDSSAELGHARMRGISVVLLGPPRLLGLMRDVARRHDAEIVFTPPESEPLGEALSRAARKAD